MAVRVDSVHVAGSSLMLHSAWGVPLAEEFPTEWEVGTGKDEKGWVAVGWTSFTSLYIDSDEPAVTSSTVAYSLETA